MFCSKCGKPKEHANLFCNKCGNRFEEGNSFTENQQVNEEKRILCSDDNCIGVIGSDGLCKECNKPYNVENENDDFDANVENFQRQWQQQQKNEQKKTHRNLILFFVAAILVLGFLGINNQNNSQDKAVSTEEPKTARQIRKEKVEEGFSAWDGSHRELEKFIKKSMNDPDSYEHVETVFIDKGDSLIVTTTFRGKNAFGGVVKNWVTAKADLDGKILEVISQGP